MRTKIGISLYRIFSRSYFYLPFLLIFFHQKGYSIIVIEYFMACYGLGAFISNKFIKNNFKTQNPKQLLIVSESLKIIGLLCLSFLSNPSLIILSQLILGISYSIGAGEDTKIINSSLENDVTDFQNISNSFMFLSLLVSGIIGGYIYNFNNVLPFLLTIIASLVSIFSIFLFLPSVLDSVNHIEKTVYKNKIDISYHAYVWISHYSIIRGIILSIFTGFLPYYFFTELGISTQYFILILAAYTLTGIISSIYCTNLPNFTSSLSLFLSLCLLLSHNIIFIVISMVLLGLSSGLTRPQTIKNLNMYKYISILLHKAESIYSCLNFFFLIIGGYIYHRYYFKGIVIFSLLTLLSYCLIQFYFQRRNQNEN